MKIKFFFQIANAEKSWEDVQPRCVEFESRDSAVSFAYALSEMFDKEVRMTVGSPKGNGYYFTHKNRPKYA